MRERLRIRLGRNPQPSAGIVYAQLAKTTGVGGEARGDDGGKKVRGRKRHLLVHTEGLLLEVRVHSAKVPDEDGIRLLLDPVRDHLPRLSHLWVDAGYQGNSGLFPNSNRATELATLTGPGSSGVSAFSLLPSPPSRGALSLPRTSPQLLIEDKERAYSLYEREHRVARFGHSRLMQHAGVKRLSSNLMGVVSRRKTGAGTEAPPSDLGRRRTVTEALTARLLEELDRETRNKGSK